MSRPLFVGCYGGLLANEKEQQKLPNEKSLKMDKPTGQGRITGV